MSHICCSVIYVYYIYVSNCFTYCTYMLCICLCMCYARMLHILYVHDSVYYAYTYATHMERHCNFHVLHAQNNRTLSGLHFTNSPIWQINCNITLHFDIQYMCIILIVSSLDDNFIMYILKCFYFRMKDRKENPRSLKTRQVTKIVQSVPKALKQKTSNKWWPSSYR